MKKNFCDECGKEINCMTEVEGKITYSRGDKNHCAGRTSYNEAFDRYGVIFELCSRKCLFKYLREHILEDVK